jgi:uncharacterized protein YjlB
MDLRQLECFIASGAAHITLGGPGGREISVRDGDVVVLPTGAGHVSLRRAPIFWSLEQLCPEHNWDII